MDKFPSISSKLHRFKRTKKFYGMHHVSLQWFVCF